MHRVVEARRHAEPGCAVSGRRQRQARLAGAVIGDADPRDRSLRLLWRSRRCDRHRARRAREEMGCDPPGHDPSRRPAVAGAERQDARAALGGQPGQPPSCRGRLDELRVSAVAKAGRGSGEQLSSLLSLDQLAVDHPVTRRAGGTTCASRSLPPTTPAATTEREASASCSVRPARRSPCCRVCPADCSPRALSPFRLLERKVRRSSSEPESSMFGASHA